MKSKFRTIFWVGNAILPVILIIVLVISLKDLFINKDFGVGNLMLIFAAIFTLIIGLNTILDIKSINLSNERIEISYVFTLKKEIVHFSEVKEIRLKKEPGSMGGYISDGYKYSELILSNKQIVISPHVYGNYNELISEINRLKSTHNA